MIKKITLIFVLFITVQSSFSQSDLDQYKYVIVPTTYEFCTERDQYQLNSLTKFLFEKQGFVALMSDEPWPQDLINNGCLALWADVLNESGIFETKFRLELKNCQKQVVFTSGVGQSREKKYKVAYNLSLRQAFESFNTIDYRYNPEMPTEVSTTTKPIKPTTITPPVALIDPAISESKEADENQALTARKKDGINYELLNDKGEVVYTLIFSGKEAFYMVEGIQATVYKINDVWVIAQTTADGSLQVETLNVTF